MRAVREDDHGRLLHQRRDAVAGDVAEPPFDPVGDAEARGQLPQRLDRVHRIAGDDEPRLGHGARRPPAGRG